MPIKPPDVKPNPADPLSNPASVPEVTPPDLPVPVPDELSVKEPKGASTPAPSPTQPGHPLGPHDVVERSL